MSLTLKQKRRIRQRVEHIGDRLNRLQKRLAAWNDAEESGLIPWLLEIIKKLVDAGRLPPMGDGDEIEWDEVIDAVADWLDEHLEPSDPKLEWLSEVGIEIAAYVAIMAYKNRKQILVARIGYNKTRLKKLRAQLEAG